jgi:hypothetical protein
MRRRALLRAAALAGAAGIAGCTSDAPGDGNGGGQGGNSPTDSPTDTPMGDPTDSPTDTGEDTPTRTPMGNGLVGQSFELTGRGCGEGKEAVDITFDGDFVRLDGVITGSDACYVAEQESAIYDAANDRLSVNVRAFRPDDEEACADCVVDISYEARYTFEGETPKEVAVSHDGLEVARAAQDSASASPPETEQGTVE